MSSVWQQVAAELAARRPVVVVSVVRDSGSVPRRTGAKMLVHADGRTVGTVGGGIFEMLVVRDALAALASNASVTRNYSFNPKGTAVATLITENLFPPEEGDLTAAQFTKGLKTVAAKVK